MKLDANPSFKHGFKFNAYSSKNEVGGGSVAIGIRNGKKMISLYLEKEDALILMEEIKLALEVSDPE